MYPDEAGLVGSTAAARLNGYLGGYGSLETLEDELESYGLSTAGTERLLRLVDRRAGGLTCPL
jgi:peptide-methionine (S)-S-oxide reductase